MKRKILSLVMLGVMILSTLTGCNSKEVTENNSQIENNFQSIVESEETPKPYNWVIEPSIEADDIIDLDVRKEVSLIKKGRKYNFINNDQGKELLRQDFYGYAALDNGEIDIWQEGGTTYKVNEDYTLQESNYAGDFSPNIVYYNTERQELFTQNHMYLVVKNDNEEILEKHKMDHGTVLESFTEVTPTSFTEDEFDVYAEFSESDLGKSGYYNKETLEIEIDPMYEMALNFYEGCAAVKKDGKAGFINLEGEELFPFEFEETRSFDTGRAWVKVNGKWGVIELTR